MPYVGRIHSGTFSRDIPAFPNNCATFVAHFLRPFDKNDPGPFFSTGTGSYGGWSQINVEAIQCSPFVCEEAVIVGH